MTSENKIIWLPVDTDAFEFAAERRTFRVEQRVMPHMVDVPRWRATTRRTGDPPSDILELCWFNDRRAAFDWCGSKHAPNVPTSSFMHLIGERT